MNIIKNIKQFAKDTIYFLKLKKIERSIHSIFFVENKYIFEYVKRHFEKQSKKKIICVSFCSQNFDTSKKNFYFFETKFYRQLFFLTNRVKYFYSSTPDLGYSIFVKSKLINSKYIYLQHSPLSLSWSYNDKAFINFNALGVVNKFQYSEALIIKKKFKKNFFIFKTRYFFIYDRIGYRNSNQDEKSKTNVIIAPTWKTNFYREQFYIKIFQNVNLSKFNLFFRPHPSSIHFNEITYNELENTGYKIDKSKIFNFQKYDILISDWSGIFIEFYFVKKTLPILLNSSTKRKTVLNEFNLSFEHYLRKKFSSTVLNMNQIDNLEFKISYALKKKIDNEYLNYFY